MNLGKLGEDRAAAYLLKQNYQLIGRNIRVLRGEIDIIAQHEKQLIIIEVKTKTTAEVAEPWQQVTKSKQRQLIKLADSYVKQEGIDLDVRFDVISILMHGRNHELTHIESAFYPSL